MTTPVITIGKQKYVKSIHANGYLIGHLEATNKHGHYLADALNLGTTAKVIKGKQKAINYLLTQVAQLLADLANPATKIYR